MEFLTAKTILSMWHMLLYLILKNPDLLCILIINIRDQKTEETERLHCQTQS